MKKNLTLAAFLLVVVIFACEKNKQKTAQPISKTESVTENYGPYGKLSKWKSISGDTVFSDTLTLSFFYTEKSSPCDVCYYQQNYPFWNDYDYTFSASKCVLAKDTLIMKDPDTDKKSIFIIIKNK